MLVQYGGVLLMLSLWVVASRGRRELFLSLSTLEDERAYKNDNVIEASQTRQLNQFGDDSVSPGKVNGTTGAERYSQDCPPPKRFPFYIYPEKNFGFAWERCQVRDELEFAQFARKPKTSNTLPELFWLQQLQQHPQRVLDPAAAQLFVLPVFLAANARGICGNKLANLRRVVQALKSSKWYLKRQGRDHMFISVDYNTQKFFYDYRVQMPTGIRGAVNQFWYTTRNFILGAKMRTGNLHSTLFHASRSKGRCIIPVPVASAFGIRRESCRMVPSSGSRVSDLDGPIFRCRPAGLEPDFETYLGSRSYTLFFAGQADSRSAYTARRVAVESVPKSLGPSFLAVVNRKAKNSTCLESSHADNVCYINQTNLTFYGDNLIRSKFSLFIRGDDPNSSRLYDAFASGTLSVKISDGFYRHVAAFTCALPWRKSLLSLNENRFLEKPEEELERALQPLLQRTPEGLALWKSLWLSQREMADDVLWHTPSSRVADNVLKDVSRFCLDV
uniref:Uncharacterized protein n=1 Tax=Tetraselmis sp. GSL018 TaxID=582737 RepID=A0A061SF85_9CHLO|mmetsp:Transcript_31060/g.73833  ORF Transcript_31060/g.73833 Transcript_31060/m.73833 type:complete len:502 (-) Transcript_31060:47-1552(-)